MESIVINSLPPKDVIRDLSKCFGTEYSRSCDEYLVKLPPSWGSGYIKGTHFKGGMGLMQYNCTFNRNLEIKFSFNQVHPLKFLYCLEGKLNHSFENESATNSLAQYQNAIVSSKGYKGHILNFSKNTYTHLCSLEINRAKFRKKLKGYLANSPIDIQYIFMEKAADASFYHEGLYSFQIAEFFKQIKMFKYNNLIKRTFMEAKAYQILTSQLIQFEDDNRHDKDKTVLRSAEVKSIREAVTIIELELDDLESVTSLAHRVGLNANKLQDGFKTIYFLTVHGYIHKVRLKLAVTLLINTRMSLKEIKEKIGLNSQSYFSKIFKDFYGHSPSEFRKMNNRKKVQHFK